MKTPGTHDNPILGAHPFGAESLLAHPLDQRLGRIADRRAARDQSRDVTVLALVHHLAPRVGRSDENSRAREMVAVQERHRLLVHQRPHDAGLHVDDDALAEPVDLARVVREHHRDRRLAARVQSGLRQAHLNRRLALLAHQVHHAAGRPGDDVGPVVILAGTGVAERRDRRIDESRIFLRERVVAEADRIEIAELDATRRESPTSPRAPRPARVRRQSRDSQSRIFCRRDTRSNRGSGRGRLCLRDKAGCAASSIRRAARP